MKWKYRDIREIGAVLRAWWMSKLVEDSKEGAVGWNEQTWRYHLGIQLDHLVQEVYYLVLSGL
jgi:hypothetical protein